jgi:hypothetical protein
MTIQVWMNFAIQLVKLHGSVNWIRNKDEKIEEHGCHLSLVLGGCQILPNIALIGTATSFI